MRRQIQKTLLILLGIAFAAIPVRSQTKPQKPSFEVVSVKPSPPRQFNLMMSRLQGDRRTLASASLKGLLGMAYRDSASGDALEIFGGPDWMESALFDVEVKADCSGGIISREQEALMFQSLLEDRFQLKAHVEMRDNAVYNLVVGRQGPKLKASADQTPPPVPAPVAQLCRAPAGTSKPVSTLPPPPPAGTDFAKFISEQLPRGQILSSMEQSSMTMTLQGRAAPVSRLVFILKQMTGRQVIDKTGLTGFFDIELKFSTDGLALPAMSAGGTQGFPGGLSSSLPSAPLAGPAVNGTPVAADPVPTLFSAIQNLGLRLEQARGPAQVIVIDSVQKPSEN
jgi:uncharacterized protein (TIGR03435 family)